VQRVELTEQLWRHLTSLRDIRADNLGALSSHGEDNALSLYSPIALRNRRFVMAQVGQSLDGRVATLSGDAQDISGCDGIAHLHRCRALVDAVIVGVGTVAADNPSLSVRAVSGKSPVRVVIDCNGRMPLDAKMLSDDGSTVLIIQGDDMAPRTRRHETILLPRSEDGIDPANILDALGERGLTSILVEGGARTISRFIDNGLVDRLHVSVAPIIIGSGPAGISLSPVDKLSQIHRPKVSVYNIGTDIVFDCDLRAAAARSEAGLTESQDILMADMA